MDFGSPQPVKPTKEWSLQKLPPKGDKDVGPYFYQLFEMAKEEKERLGIPERLLENYKMYRNAHWTDTDLTPKNERVSLNFFFANVNRTVANMTANSPVAEVVGADGIEDESDQILNQKIKLWNNEAEHGQSLNKSGLNMEIYGITIEKHVWNAKKNAMDTVVIDPFSFFPAPGYYEEIADMPYVCQAYPMSIDAIKSKFNVPKDVEIATEDTYSLLGEERQEARDTGQEEGGRDIRVQQRIEGLFGGEESGGLEGLLEGDRLQDEAGSCGLVGPGQEDMRLLGLRRCGGQDGGF